MKVRYQRPKPNRIKGGSLKVGDTRYYNFLWVEVMDSERGFLDKESKPCRTVKAAIRWAKKYPKGTKLRLVSRFQDYDVFITA